MLSISTSTIPLITAGDYKIHSTELEGSSFSRSTDWTNVYKRASV